MQKLSTALALLALLLLASSAEAAVTTSRNGYAATLVYCHAYENYIGANTEMTDESGALVQPVRWEIDVQRWNGHAWYTYASHLVSLPDGGSAYYPYAFHVQGGYDYRVDATYGWAQEYPNPTLYGSEIVPFYTQYGNNFPTRNGHFQRAHYCYV